MTKENQKRLAAQQHVGDAAVHVENQRQLIHRLERDGHDTSDARALSKAFEESLEAQREFLRKVEQWAPSSATAQDVEVPHGTSRSQIHN
jgi:hypothetical protein